jgi:uncharacterized protein (TIGR02597 family)
MKPSSFSLPPSLLAAISLACISLTSASAQTTASTTPVGFVTLNAFGTGTSSGPYTFNGLSVAPPVVAQGTSTAVGTNTITDTTQSWTQDEFDAAAGPYYVEITGPTGGAGIGTMYDITATNASTQTITLAQNLVSGVVAGATYRIRAHWTISTVFGPSGSLPLQVTGGVATASGANPLADLILVWDNTLPTPGYDTFYYKIKNGVTTGWTEITSGTPVATPANAILYPEQGIIIQRQGSANTSITLMGAAKEGQISIPVVNGYNFIGNPFPAPLTLGTCGLYTGSTATGIAGGVLTPSGSNTLADQVLIWDNTQNPPAYNTFYYKIKNGVTTGWTEVTTGTPVAVPANYQIGVGACIIVQTNGSGFNWIVQQPAAY